MHPPPSRQTATLIFECLRQFYLKSLSLLGTAWVPRLSRIVCPSVGDSLTRRFLQLALLGCSGVRFCRGFIFAQPETEDNMLRNRNNRFFTVFSREAIDRHGFGFAPDHDGAKGLTIR